MRSAALAVALFLALPAAASAAPVELKPFDAQAPAAIRAARAGQPFVLAFWSVNCAPCRDELPHWSALQRRHPQVPILLVATDPAEEQEAVKALLARHGLAEGETWTFADDYLERVRYAVDPRWRGELPRSYFFDARHQADARSGRLDPAWVESWLARQAAGR